MPLRSWSDRPGDVAAVGPARAGAGRGRRTAPPVRAARRRPGRRPCAGPPSPASGGRRGPTPGRIDTDRGARKAWASAPPITEKPPGLSRSEAILARNLLAARPTETVMPISRSISPWARASCSAAEPPFSRWVPARSTQASSSDERLDQGGERGELGHDPPALGAVFAEIGFDDSGLRAELQGLEHRHGPSARHRSAPHSSRWSPLRRRPPPTITGQVAQLGPVALLHRGVEGVTVHMGDGQPLQFGCATTRGEAQRGQRAAGAPPVHSSRGRGRSRPLRRPQPGRAPHAGRIAVRRRAYRGCRTRRRTRAARRRRAGVVERPGVGHAAPPSTITSGSIRSTTSARARARRPT